MKSQFLLLILFSTLGLNSQTCGDGSVITITSQAVLNTFTTTYNGCTTFDGGIKLIGSDITDLSPLSSIKYISKELWIFDTHVSSLNGLNSLDSVNNGLLIQGNPNLVSIDALHNLSKINFYFLLSNNINLERTDGLISLSYLTGYLNVSYNPKLKACCGFFPLLVTGGVTGTITFGPSNDASCDEVSDITGAGFISVDLNRCYTSLDEAISYAAGVNGIVGTYLPFNNLSPITIPSNVTLRIYASQFENMSTIINNGLISLNGGTFQNNALGIYRGVGTFKGNFLNNGIVLSEMGSMSFLK